jgi:hypothetical protein
MVLRNIINWEPNKTWNCIKFLLVRLCNLLTLLIDELNNSYRFISFYFFEFQFFTTGNVRTIRILIVFIFYLLLISFLCKTFGMSKNWANHKVINIFDSSLIINIAVEFLRRVDVVTYLSNSSPHDFSRDA